VFLPAPRCCWFSTQLYSSFLGLNMLWCARWIESYPSSVLTSWKLWTYQKAERVCLLLNFPCGELGYLVLPVWPEKCRTIPCGRGGTKAISVCSWHSLCPARHGHAGARAGRASGDDSHQPLGMGQLGAGGGFDFNVFSMKKESCIHL